MSERAGGVRLGIWIPIVIVVFDQITKAVVRQTLALHESIPVVPGVIRTSARR